MERSFRRELSSLEPLFEFTGELARRHGLDDDTAFAMNLAVEEIFTNMVKYGGGGDTVAIGVDVHGGDLVIEFVHPGAVPFDVTTAGEVEVESPLTRRAPGGIGLHLVRTVMDGVSYAHENGGAHVTLTKHLGGD